MQEGVLCQRLYLHKITGPGAEHLFGLKTKTMATLENWPRGLSARHCLRRERWFTLCQAPLSETTERGSLDRLSDASRCRVMGRSGSCSYETLTQ